MRWTHTSHYVICWAHNTEINTTWWRSCGMYAELDDTSAHVKCLWPIRTWNVRPSRKCRKCFTASYAARSCLPKVLSRHSEGVSCFEKNETSCHAPSMNCWKIAVTAVSDPSSTMVDGAVNLGWASIAMSAKASLKFAPSLNLVNRCLSSSIVPSYIGTVATFLG